MEGETNSGGKEASFGLDDISVVLPGNQSALGRTPNSTNEVQIRMENELQLEPFPPFIQFNSQPENGFPPEFFQPAFNQPIAPVNYNSTFGGDGRGQFILTFSQPQDYYPAWMNQQQPPNEQWLSLNVNAPAGPQNLPNNEIQLHNHQVPGMPNVYEQNFVPLDPSGHHSPQQFPNQMLNQGQMMPQDPSVHHSPQQFPYQMLNEGQMMPPGSEIMLPHPSLTSRPPLPGTPQYDTPVPNHMLPWHQEHFNPHHQPFQRRMSISEFLATPFDPRELEQQYHLLNSGHIYQDTRGNENIQFPRPLQSDTVPPTTNRKGKETRGARKTLEQGESSSQKRRKVQTTTPESNASQNTDGNSNALTLSHPRPALRNSVYDPAFETMGLPVDPHLRMFSQLK
ncbi:uncharacterized protein [Euphorbia lathyris]|uniref:uncharacterized protein n=1 Tax=Euphorbia lathyris TaxID=212925 RepID=UPI0033141E2C